MNPENIKKIGSNIRALRKSLGFSQERLANEAGIHRTYMSSIERGHQVPSIAILCKIAKALDYELSELLDAIQIDQICKTCK